MPPAKRRARAAALFALAGLVGACATVAWGGWRARAQASAPIDVYGLRETAPDLPSGWKLSPDLVGYYRGVDANARRGGPGVLDRWMGSVTRPDAPPSPSNKIMAAASIWITVYDSPAAAREAFAGRAGVGGNIQARPTLGSYSGQAIGDVCLRGAHRADDDSAAALWFVRGSACYRISMSGPYGSTGYRAAAESLAVALVNRYDAVAALAAAQPVSSTLGGQAVSGKSPNGVPVVILSTVTGLQGAQVTRDIPGGTATVTTGGHTLVLHIGRTEATLDGKALTLPFAALRSGPADVWCPVETLRKLGM